MLAVYITLVCADKFEIALTANKRSLVPGSSVVQKHTLLNSKITKNTEL